MGGAMDLVAGVQRVIVLMDHCSKAGEHKILRNCDLPLTGVGVVNMIISDLCVLAVTPDGLELRELAQGVSLEEVQEKTGAAIHTAPVVMR
ncbi:MAG: CoA-transferase, partial [Methyloversatilis sp.]|nr:CoA-transferase [Methyloversatilis sp.]